MLCKVCGSQIADDALECEFCGANLAEDADNGEEIIEESELEDVNDAEEAIYDENERKRQSQMKRMMQDKQNQLSEIERRRNEKRQKQKRNKILLVTLICALAVAAAGIGVYYVAQNMSGATVVQTTPMPTVSAMPAITPSVSPSVSPMPTVDTTVAPYTESNSTSTTSSNTQSWTPVNGSSNSGTSTSTASNTAASSGTGSSASMSSGSNTASSNANTVANAVNSGISTSKISSQISVGGEVIKNTGTGKYLMTFVTGGKKYYAHVSEGSTTEQVKNKTYTITANPTGETYNGNTVYEITTLTKYEGDYILPTSGTKKLTNADIKGLSKYDLALARNEIYARHGRKFQTAEYNKYFKSKSWYQINPNYDYSDDNANLNSIELENVNFILKAER